MIYVSYTVQRSFPEYIDMEFKELHLGNYGTDRMPINNHEDLAYMLIDGYWPSFLDDEKIPVWLYDRVLSVKKRVVKKFSKKLFYEFGEPEKTVKIVNDINDYFDSLPEYGDEGELDSGFDGDPIF